MSFLPFRYRFDIPCFTSELCASFECGCGIRYLCFRFLCLSFRRLVFFSEASVRVRGQPGAFSGFGDFLRTDGATAAGNL